MIELMEQLDLIDKLYKQTHSNVCKRQVLLTKMKREKQQAEGRPIQERYAIMNTSLTKETRKTNIDRQLLQVQEQIMLLRKRIKEEGDRID